MSRFIFTFLALVLTCQSQAETVCEAEKNCIDLGQWEVSIAFGLGVRSNPLVDGSPFPNLALFDIAWYGKNAYFDNGELGYKLLDSQRFGAETYLTVDREKSHFDLWHSSNFTVSALVPPAPSVPSDGSTDGPRGPEEVFLSIDDISSRKWAIHGGSRFHYYGEGYEWLFAFETDVSSVHKGHKAMLSYDRFWKGEDWTLSLRSSVIWKSDNVIDYYYGIDARDTSVDTFFYQGKGGFQPSIGLSYTYKINPRWYFIGNGSIQKLHSGMTNSPIVEADFTTNLFIGFGYRL